MHVARNKELLQNVFRKYYPSKSAIYSPLTVWTSEENFISDNTTKLRHNFLLCYRVGYVRLCSYVKEERISFG